MFKAKKEKYQDEYYNAISKCHVNGNSTFFIEFMLKQIDSVLEEIATQINEDSEQLSDCVRKLLDVMEYDVAYHLAYHLPYYLAYFFP